MRLLEAYFPHDDIQEAQKRAFKPRKVPEQIPPEAKSYQSREITVDDIAHEFAKYPDGEGGRFPQPKGMDRVTLRAELLRKIPQEMNVDPEDIQINFQWLDEAVIIKVVWLEKTGAFQANAKNIV